MSYELIETVTVGAGGAASIEFTSIPQDGTDLVLMVSLRGLKEALTESVLLNINGSFADQIGVQVRGNGTSIISGTAPRFIGHASAATSSSNTFGNASLYFSNYSSSANKSFFVDTVMEHSDTFSTALLGAYSYNNSLPITTITVYSASENWAEYSTASLYKITAA